MKVSIDANNSSSSVRITPALGFKRQSYRSSVIHAAAALQTLSDQYRLKKARIRKKTGHA